MWIDLGFYNEGLHDSHLLQFVNIAISQVWKPASSDYCIVENVCMYHI